MKGQEGGKGGIGVSDLAWAAERKNPTGPACAEGMRGAGEARCWEKVEGNAGGV